MREQRSKPLVSVVIPCYNAEKYISAAVESVLGQTYQTTEIIVVDDGSTDRSKAELEKFGTSISLISQKNAGVSTARNVGIAASKGELVAFLDADDTWLPSKLSLQVPLFDDASVGLVHGYHNWVSDAGAVLKEARFDTCGMAFHEILRECTIGVHTAVVRREVFNSTSGFNTDFQGAADWDMWLRIAAVWKIDVAREILSNYRVHGNNMSADMQHMRDDQLKVLTLHSHVHQSCKQCRVAIKDSYRRIQHCYAAWEMHRALERSRAGKPAMTWLLDAVFLNPYLLKHRGIYSIAARVGLNRIGIAC